MSENSRRQFDTRLVELFDKKDQSSSHLTAEKYNWIINRLIALSVGDVKKVTKDYRLVKMYELIAIPFDDRTVQRLQKPGTNLLYVSHDDMFDAIRAIHLATRHGARDAMHDRAKQQYVNLTKEVLQAYSVLCEECQAKRGSQAHSTSADSKPKVSNMLKSRCQVDIVDMQDRADGNYHYIMTYQDYRTKLVTLKPLRTNQTREIVSHLLDIFCMFGCPLILQSNYGRTYSLKIVQEINRIWPECVLVHGKMNNGGSDADAHTSTSRDMEAILTRWMKEKSTTRWSQGLHVIQWQLNNSKNVDIDQKPFNAMFSQNSRCGLKSTNLSLETIAALRSEDDLIEVMNRGSVSLGAPSSFVLFDKTHSQDKMVTHGVAQAPSLLQVDATSLIGNRPVTLSSDCNSCPGSYMSISNRGSTRNTLSLGVNIPLSEPKTKDQEPRNKDHNGLLRLLKTHVESSMAARTPAAEKVVSLPRSSPDIHFETICSVCKFTASGSHRCSGCKNVCHETSPCSQRLTLGSQSSSMEILCLMCQRSKLDQRFSNILKPQQSERAFTPSFKQCKHFSECNLRFGTKSHTVPIAEHMDMELVGMDGELGRRTVLEQSVSPFLPFADMDTAFPHVPSAFKSRIRSPLLECDSSGGVNDPTYVPRDT